MNAEAELTKAIADAGASGEIEALRARWNEAVMSELAKLVRLGRKRRFRRRKRKRKMARGWA